MGYDINMKWHITLHHALEHHIASCTGTSHFMGVGAWLESNTIIADLVSGIATVTRSPIKSHDCIK